MDVTGIQGVYYFKVTLNSHVQKNYVEFKFFYFSIEYTEDNLRNFIEVLHVYVTGHREVTHCECRRHTSFPDSISKMA